MKVVFLAGPYNASCLWHFRENIQFAEDMAAEVWKEGAACICPHPNSGWMHGCAPEFMFEEGYLEILKRCDAVLAIPGWENSNGARAEVAAAKRCDIPVFESLENLKTWLRNHAQP